MHMLANMNERIRFLFPLLVLTAGVNHDQEEVNRPKGSPWHHIYYVEKGRGVMITPDGKYELEEGHVYFFKSNLPVHYYRVTEEFVSAWVTFIGKGVEDILDYYGAKNVASLKSESIYPMISNIYRLVERGESPDVLSKHLYEIIVLFFNRLNHENMPPTLIKAQQYIDANYAHDISVADIAKHLGVSESLIYKLFKERGEMTPTEYLRSVRIHAAEKLLMGRPKMQISEVSQSCGFSDLAYFCKVFKSVTGISPKKYQKTYNA